VPRAVRGPPGPPPAGAAERGGRAAESGFGAGRCSIPAAPGSGGSRGAPAGSATAAGRRAPGGRGISEVKWHRRNLSGASSLAGSPGAALSGAVETPQAPAAGDGKPGKRQEADRRNGALIGFAVQSLRNWRFLGRGPSYIKRGRSVRYRLKDVLEWAE
jgi:hypothetical protein